MACIHCRNGFLENKFGQDVECVNGVLIDIDVAHEGWQRDVDYPVAPCHPMWQRQQAGDEDFPNDSQERLSSWSEEGASDAEAERDGEIKRVIALLQTDTGPSRDLDWEIAEALGGSVRLVSGLGLNGRTKGSNRLFWPHTTTRRGHAIPYYTKDRAKAVAKLRALLTPTPAPSSGGSGKPVPSPDGVVTCPCTTFEQDEDCPVGFPSLLCSACDGKGIATLDKVVALAAEMMKVAEQVDELEDPFAAWESIELLKSQAPKDSPVSRTEGIEDLIDTALFRIGPYLNGTYSDATRRSIVRATVEEIVTALSATATEGE